MRFINLLEVAKRHLESTGAGVVLGGFMAPSGDSFLRAKLNKKPKEAPNFISAEDRCNMIDLALENSDWLVCDRYESFHNIRAAEAKSHLDNVIKEHYLTQGAQVTVLGVCGIDALSNIKSQATIKANLFIVNRKQDDGSDPHAIVRQHHLRDHIQVVWAPNWEECDISSSALRRLWAQEQDISHITPPAVIEYMKQKGIQFAYAPKETKPKAQAEVPVIQSTEEFNRYLRTFYQPTLDIHKNIQVRLISESELSGPQTVVGYGVSGACYLRMWNNQPVAVKTFVFGDSERNSIKWHMTTVAREAILTFGMDHPNVCKLLGCGLGTNSVFLVFEYAGDSPKAEPRFASLLQQCADDAKFPSKSFLALLRDIAAGLAYVHNVHHVIHRDIQLQNVLIHSDGRAMVADWGQAKEMDDQLKVLRGSCRHYPPESLARPKHGQAPYTKASDVFMFGTVMYEAAQGGKRFWSELETGDACKKTMNGELPDLPPHITHDGQKREFSSEFVQLMRRCLNFASHYRPTFDQVVEELERMISEIPS